MSTEVAVMQEMGNEKLVKRKNNEQVMKAARRKWLEKNPGGALEATRQWRKRNQDKIHEYNKLYRSDNPTSNRRNWLKRYGMTLEQYNELLNSQNGTCAICKTPPTRKHLSIDHCHSSGAVRGLLCITCNTMIGHAREEVSRLESAIQYLLFHKGAI